MNIVAKDQTNYLVAGSLWNVSQDSGLYLPHVFFRKDALVEKITFGKATNILMYVKLWMSDVFLKISGHIVVSMMCDKEWTWCWNKQSKQK